MKKLLLLALLPSLSFAYEPYMSSIPKGLGDTINMTFSVGGHYAVNFKNSTHKKCTYKYIVKLCAEGKECKIHETEYHLEPGEVRMRTHALSQHIKYNQPGRYKLVASQQLTGCGLSIADEGEKYLYVFE